ncbi:MAG: hypothetical protein KatS3mg060_2998 [Dehalococcoidia bacterium]|nr:MAG: hypothetical protein KatS3mg060_2998 [Dehalococcoidia bacterium]
MPPLSLCQPQASHRMKSGEQYERVMRAFGPA